MTANAPTHDLAWHWQQLSQTRPGLRIRDAANELNVSEAELLASQLQAGDFRQQQVQRLQGPFGALIQQLQQVGEVMALTRNDAMVHEKTGTYQNVTLHGPEPRQMGLALGQIDLRLFLQHFVHGFAVSRHSRHGVRHSLQFFDASGTAVHKVFTTANTDLQAWHSLQQNWLATDQSTPLELQAEVSVSLLQAPALLDLAALRQDWQDLKDVHHFQTLLKKYAINRVPAYRLIGTDYAVELDICAFTQALEAARDRAMSVMIFVGNKGCIQIHTGVITHLKALAEWFNILDEGFNLHADTSLIRQVWLVRKPTSDGIITSLEMYDRHGQQLALMFGERHNGEAEQAAWRQLASELQLRLALQPAHNRGPQP